MGCQENNSTYSQGYDSMYSDLIYKVSYFPHKKRYKIQEMDDVHVLRLCKSGNLCREVQVSEDIDYLEYFVYVNIRPDFSLTEDDIYLSALSQGSLLIRKSISKFESEFCGSCCRNDNEDEEVEESIASFDWNELIENATKYKKVIEEIADILKIIDTYKKLYGSVPSPWAPSPSGPWEVPSVPPFDPFYPCYPYVTETTTNLKVKIKDNTNDDIG